MDNSNIIRVGNMKVVWGLYRLLIETKELLWHGDVVIAVYPIFSDKQYTGEWLMLIIKKKKDSDFSLLLFEDHLYANNFKLLYANNFKLSLKYSRLRIDGDRIIIGGMLEFKKEVFEEIEKYIKIYESGLMRIIGEI